MRVNQVDLTQFSIQVESIFTDLLPVFSDAETRIGNWQVLWRTAMI